MKFFAVYTNKADTSIIGIRECHVDSLRGAKNVIMGNRPEGAALGSIYLCTELDAEGRPVPNSVFDRCVMASWSFNSRVAIKRLQAIVASARS